MANHIRGGHKSFNLSMGGTAYAKARNRKRRVNSTIVGRRRQCNSCGWWHQIDYKSLIDHKVVCPGEKGHRDPTLKVESFLHWGYRLCLEPVIDLVKARFCKRGPSDNTKIGLPGSAAPARHRHNATQLQLDSVRREYGVNE